nr:hypothetical protein [uncultured Kingella sp.]
MDKYRFRLPFSTPIFCQIRRFAAYHEQGQAPAPHAHNHFRLPTIAPAPVMRANPLHPYKYRRAADAPSRPFSGCLYPAQGSLKAEGFNEVKTTPPPFAPLPPLV